MPQDLVARALGSDGGMPCLGGRLTAELRRGDGVCWVRTRVVSYVEYDLEGIHGRVHGCETCENAYQGEVRSDSRWLRAVTPPFNAFADRRTCSEFRFFDRLVEGLAARGLAGDPAARAAVRGGVSMLISAPPCVSCVGVIRQFQLLFPNVGLRIAGGRPPEDLPGGAAGAPHVLAAGEAESREAARRSAAEMAARLSSLCRSA